MSAPHAIVIGAGFGGLAAAIRLRARGWKVTVLEANDQAGGRAAVWEQDGFRFDAGPTVITAPYLLDELFGLVGRRREDYFDLVPVDPFYRVEFNDGSRFDYVGEEDRLLAQIKELSPRDVDGYRKLAAHAKSIFDIGYEQLAHVPFDKLSQMLRVIPDMLRLQNHRTVYGLVSKYIQDERLRQVFTFQPLLVGGNPFSTSSIYMLIHWLERKWGVHFAKGGTGAIVRSLVQLLEELDVDIQLNAPVGEILVKDGGVRGVRLEDGRSLMADIVVSNADPTMVYQRLLPAHARSLGARFKAGRMKQSMSLFVLYFGTNKVYEDLKHHTIILGPRYRELLDDIFRRKVLADDYSLYLHAPGRSDPSMAPAGHDAFYVLSPVPNLGAEVDWETEAPRYKEAILTGLERYMPNLREHLVTSHTVDPRYFAGRLRSAEGAAFGPEPVLQQSAWFRYHNTGEGVDRLFFVGAGTHPGAGVPGVLSSARVLDRVVPELPELLQAPVPRRALPRGRVA